MKKEFDSYKFVITAFIFAAIIIAVGISRVSEVDERSQIDPKPEQSKLDKCIEEANENFHMTLELNSHPSPQEGYPDAVMWNSTEIKVRTEDNLRKDKELCIKLYK